MMVAIGSIDKLGAVADGAASRPNAAMHLPETEMIHGRPSPD